MNLVPRLKQIDFPQVALFLGPFLVVIGFALLASRFYISSNEIHAHVERIANRDVEWEPIVKLVKSNASHVFDVIKRVDEFDANVHVLIAKQDEILKKQEELFAAIQNRKLGELHTKQSRQFSGSVTSFGSDARRNFRPELDSLESRLTLSSSG